MQRNWPLRDGLFSEPVAALQRDFLEADIERSQIDRNWNRSFAALVNRYRLQVGGFTPKSGYLKTTTHARIVGNGFVEADYYAEWAIWNETVIATAEDNLESITKGFKT